MNLQTMKNTRIKNLPSYIRFIFLVVLRICYESLYDHHSFYLISLSYAI